MQVSFDAIPMADGLKIGASYFEFDKQGDEGKKDQDSRKWCILRYLRNW